MVVDISLLQQRRPCDESSSSERGRRRVSSKAAIADESSALFGFAHAAPGTERLPPEAFYQIALSNYASPADRAASPYRRRLALTYQRHYLEAIAWLARRRRCQPKAARR